MKQGYLMGFDAGGGGGRCLLIEIGTGRMTSAFRRWTHPAAPDTAGMGFDLSLDAIWAGLGEAAREALARANAPADQVLAIAVTSMRFAAVVLDAEGQALLATPNRDGRAVLEGMQLAGERGEELYARTGHWPGPVSTVSRLRWLADQRSALWQRAASVLALSDWVAYRLCGTRATDPSQASDTGLFDLRTRDWAWDLIDQLGIPRHLFPPPHDAGSRVGSLSATAAAALGLLAGTPVVAGGGDTQCGLLGAAAVAPGQAAAILGTSAPVQLILDRPSLDPRQRLRTACHVVPSLWVLESNGGLMGEALEWMARLFYPGARHAVARFLAEAGSSPPGAGGMLSTVGAEIMNGKELGLPTGSVMLSHFAAPDETRRRAHLARAVIEGMACGLRANLEQVIEASGVQPAAVALGGGMTRSDLVVQVVSDMLQRPVDVSATADTSALGAALCAGVGAGVFTDLGAAVRALAQPARRVMPLGERTATYQDLYGVWRQLRAAGQDADRLAAQAILPAVLASATTETHAAAAVRPRILVTADVDEEGLGALRQLGDVEYASFRQAMRLLTGRTLVEALQGVQVFVTEVDIVDGRALQDLPDLRVVASCRGDAVNVDLAACTAFGVPVLNAPGRNAEAVADLTVAFLLMLARKLPQAAAFLHEPGIDAGDVGRMGLAFTTLQGRELWRKTIGLVGCGAVGRAVATRLAGFGARVIVADPYIAPEEVLFAGAEPVSLDELLTESDFVSLHAAVTSDSKSLIGAAELARMKPGACLVNTARAALVDQVALLEALRSSRLAGAALDVFPVEPPPSDHPLLALDNVIATPHVGGNTVEVATHQGQIIAADLNRLLRGERPLHVRNPEVLCNFSWTAPRPQPSAARVEELAKRPAPAVSDLQRDRGAAAATPAAPPLAVVRAPSETGQRMDRILRGFVERIAGDLSLRAAAAGKDVGLGFSLTDLGLAFHLSLRDGRVSAGVGSANGHTDVDLKMPAEILDGMFTGAVNAMQAAMSGRLSFSGDTVKAMALQELQDDLARLYRLAREEVGGPGDLTAAAASVVLPGNGGVPRLAGGDIRSEVVQVVNELYAAQLVTATGGNVSVRIPGKAGEIWITPSQLFKGNLRPEILVRVDLDGRSLDDGALAPSSERLMHCAVYRARPEAQAVIHAHAPHATVLANAGLPFLPISTEAAFFGDIPRIPFIMPGTQELADAIAAAARDSWAVLMQNHGLLVAGRTLRRAADMVEIIDRSAEVMLGCYAVGREPPTLPEETVTMLQKLGDLMA